MLGGVVDIGVARYYVEVCLVALDNDMAAVDDLLCWMLLAGGCCDVFLLVGCSVVAVGASVRAVELLGQWLDGHPDDVGVVRDLVVVVMAIG